MPRLTILTPQEQKIFDNPPNFSVETRARLFKLTSYEYEIIDSIIKPLNKIYFFLQLIYFKHSARLFNSKQFNLKDLEHIAKILNLPINNINIKSYPQQTAQNHQNKILEYLGWQKLNNSTKHILKSKMGL